MSIVDPLIVYVVIMVILSIVALDYYGRMK